MNKKKNRSFPPLLINGWEDTALIKSLMKLTANNLRKSSRMKDYCCFCYRTYQIWHQINFSSGYECHNILRTEIRITMWTQMSSNRFFFFFHYFLSCVGIIIARMLPKVMVGEGVKLLYFYNYQFVEKSDLWCHMVNHTVSFIFKEKTCCITAGV